MESESCEDYEISVGAQTERRSVAIGSRPGFDREGPGLNPKLPAAGDTLRALAKLQPDAITVKCRATIGCGSSLDDSRCHWDMRIRYPRKPFSRREELDGSR